MCREVESDRVSQAARSVWLHIVLRAVVQFPLIFSAGSQRLLLCCAHATSLQLASNQFDAAGAAARVRDGFCYRYQSSLPT